jgi:elongation factor P
MNQTTFEQIAISKKKIGEKTKLLKENLEVIINFFEDNLLSVELPISIEYKVISTDASLKGQTVSSSYKPAIINNDLKILVPPFIENGDEITVDSRSLEYIKKIK